MPFAYFGLVGENGNGNTTLLRSLARELACTSGHIRYHFPASDDYELRTRLVYIPQRPGYYAFYAYDYEQGVRPHHWLDDWVSDFAFQVMFDANVVAVFVAMAVLSVQIRRWKGIPEE